VAISTGFPTDFLVKQTEIRHLTIDNQLITDMRR
jgi:hypothetical protein